MSAQPRRRLLVTRAGEIHLKSRRTRGRYERVLRTNLQAVLDRLAPDARLASEGDRLVVDVAPAVLADEPALDGLARALGRVFGIHRVDLGIELPADDLDRLTREVARLASDRVSGLTFAVRVHRRGEHSWRSPDAARALGSALEATAAGVDLDHPQVEVVVEVYGEVGYLVDRRWAGAAGAPLGTQDGVLALFSGGFDSPVAAWMAMRRGSPVQLVHFMLDCASSDHAVTVAHELTRWSAGCPPVLWKLDFQPVKDALLDTTPPRLRQVVLKQLMYAAADRLAERLDLAALVTGESLGQVSSQTLRSLVEIERMASRPVLRPLVGLTKDEIIDRARAIGTADVSARAREVCDLSEGPVAVAPRTSSLSEARSRLPEQLVADALGSLEVIPLDGWRPGQPGMPVDLERLGPGFDPRRLAGPPEVAVDHGEHEPGRSIADGAGPRSTPRAAAGRRRAPRAPAPT